MRQAARWQIGVTLLAAALAGCASARRPGAGASARPELPVVQRGSVEANIKSMPSLPTKDGAPVSEPPPSHSYRALTPMQCQCLAADAAILAELQQAEAGMLPQRGLRNALRPRATAAAMRRDVLELTSLEIRNRAAGGALEAYYHLAEAEGKADLLAQGIKQLEKAHRETRDMLAQKLKPPVALDVWTRQLLSSQADQVTADMTINQLNSELRRLLALQDCGEDWRIWNPESYEVSDAPIDVEAAVAEGLARRPELQLLRLVIEEMGEGSLPAARDLLRSIEPLLGSAHPARGLIKLAAILKIMAEHRTEVATRRGQLDEYLRNQESSVAEEIRQAAGNVRYRARLVALAWEREKSWEEKLREVESRQRQGLAASAELTQTMLELLKSRGEVIQEVMAWQIARVKLKQAQGLLVAECVGAGCGN